MQQFSQGVIKCRVDIIMSMKIVSSVSIIPGKRVGRKIFGNCFKNF